MEVRHGWRSDFLSAQQVCDGGGDDLFEIALLSNSIKDEP
jgi:hypothetical protein